MSFRLTSTPAEDKEERQRERRDELDPENLDERHALWPDAGQACAHELLLANLTVEIQPGHTERVAELLAEHEQPCRGASQSGWYGR